VISNVVFVVENAIIDKEMHSHKLSAMADNYPADWCINRERHLVVLCHTRHNKYDHTNFFGNENKHFVSCVKK